MRLSENKKTKIIEMLKCGYSNADISDETGISIRTIQRFKKDIPKAEFNEIDANGIITKTEKKFLDRVKGEKELFEDLEEGWVYHMTTERLNQQTSGLWWKWIAYPESVEFEEMAEKFKQLGLETAISPLHNRDTWGHDSPEIVNTETGEITPKGSRYKCGDRKKPHYHGITKFEKQIGYKEANRIIREITQGPYIQKCMSLTGSYEYFVHKNNPEKFQYDKDEITNINDFVLEPTKKERKLMTNEIGKVISKNRIENFIDLVRFYTDQIEYINIIASSSYYFGALCQSIWHEKHPEKITKNMLVDEDGNPVEICKANKYKGE